MTDPTPSQSQQVGIPLRFTPMGLQLLLECINLGPRGRVDELFRDIQMQLNAWQNEQAAKEKAAKAAAPAVAKAVAGIVKRGRKHKLEPVPPA